MRRYLATALAVELAVAMLPSAALAQTRELHRDREDIRQAKRDLDRAQRYGQPHHVDMARDNLGNAQREYRADWREYRARNRGLYARGEWHAPFHYERFTRGARVRPSFYDRRWFISDYRRYHLPRPPAGARWVRHYDDVILVDTRSARVIDVIYGLFV